MKYTFHFKNLKFDIIYFNAINLLLDSFHNYFSLFILFIKILIALSFNSLYGTY
jgi:hypothetical protein